MFTILIEQKHTRRRIRAQPALIFALFSTVLARPLFAQDSSSTEFLPDLGVPSISAQAPEPEVKKPEVHPPSVQAFTTRQATSSHYTQTLNRVELRAENADGLLRNYGLQVAYNQGEKPAEFHQTGEKATANTSFHFGESFQTDAWAGASNLAIQRVDLTQPYSRSLGVYGLTLLERPGSTSELKLDYNQDLVYEGWTDSTAAKELLSSRTLSASANIRISNRFKALGDTHIANISDGNQRTGGNISALYQASSSGVIWWTGLGAGTLNYLRSADYWSPPMHSGWGLRNEFEYHPERGWNFEATLNFGRDQDLGVEVGTDFMARLKVRYNLSPRWNCSIEAVHMQSHPSRPEGSEWSRDDANASVQIYL